MIANVPVALSGAPGRYWPGDEPTEQRPIRRWRVLHACDALGNTAMVAEAQIQAGMRPSLLTPDGWYRPGKSPRQEATALSLIHEWQQVRQWRTRLVAEEADTWAEIVHAHCFAAVMAALRGNTAVVYDLVSPVGADAFPKAGAWLLRSLRVAEQFALSRADALVVHSNSMWADALNRGARHDDLFLVPEPVELAASELPPARSGITLFAPDVFGNAGQGGAPAVMVVLQAFASLATEVENIQLLIEACPDDAERVMIQAQKHRVAEHVRVIAPAERPQAMAAAHIVIAGTPGDDRPNPTISSALAHGRALLAADVPQNREVTPQGRGCLWYRAGEARDLAGRAAFLARNPDFRAALSISGREHLQSTCGPMAVARKYDDVYRHAYLRRRSGSSDMLRKLEVAQACF